MTNYPYGYCGMPCALCTRYRTNGVSKCLGCSEGGYYTDNCKVHDCCLNKQLNCCGNCDQFVCQRLGKMGEFSNLRTDNAKLRTCKAVAEKGFEGWYEDYLIKCRLLDTALDNYNDGRMKRYLCELFICRDTATLKLIMQQAESLTGDAKQKATGFKQIVNALKEN